MIRLKDLLVEQSNNKKPEPDVKMVGNWKLLRGKERLVWDTKSGFWYIQYGSDIQNVVRRNGEAGKAKLTTAGTLDPGTISFIIRKYVGSDGGITNVELRKVSKQIYAIKTSIDLGNSNQPGRSDAEVTLGGFIPGYTYIIYDADDNSKSIKFKIPEATDSSEEETDGEEEIDGEDNKNQDENKLKFRRNTDILNRTIGNKKYEAKLRQYIKLKRGIPYGVQVIDQAGGVITLEIWKRTSATDQTIPLNDGNFESIKTATLKIESILEQQALEDINKYITEQLNCDKGKFSTPIIQAGKSMGSNVNDGPLVVAKGNLNSYNIYITSAVSSYYHKQTTKDDIEAPVTSIYYASLKITTHADVEKWRDEHAPKSSTNGSETETETETGVVDSKIKTMNTETLPNETSKWFAESTPYTYHPGGRSKSDGFVYRKIGNEWQYLTAAEYNNPVTRNKWKSITATSSINALNAAAAESTQKTLKTTNQ